MVEELRKDKDEETGRRKEIEKRRYVTPKRKQYEEEFVSSGKRKKVVKKRNATQKRKDYQKSYREKYKTKHALQRKQKLIDKIEKDTGFEAICCSCNEFKSRASCTKASIIPPEKLDEFVLLEENFNASKDGIYYICKSCRSLIKREIITPKNEKDLSEWANFPPEFLEKVRNTSHCKETLMMNVNSLDISDPKKLEKNTYKMQLS